jgi:hypothetical protein
MTKRFGKKIYENFVYEAKLSDLNRLKNLKQFKFQSARISLKPLLAVSSTSLATTKVAADKK